MNSCIRLAKLALLLAAFIFPGLSYAQVSLNLTAGWNLLGNSSASPIAVATMFGDPARFTTVWKWNASASRWAFYAPSMTSSALTTYTQGKGYDVLTSIAPKEGFWVNAATTAALSGPAASGVTLVASDLQQGWNLTGSADNKTPSQLNQALNSGLSAAGKAIVTVWAWDAAKANWKFYAPSLEAQGTLATYIASKNYLAFSSTLSAAEGFWVNIGAASATTSTAATTTTTTTATTTTTTLSSAGSATNFTAAAMAGELLVYTLNTSALTYSYTITESQYGLTGRTASGTLTNNGDGTYTPSGVTNGKVARLANGLLLTSIREPVRGTPVTIPVMGISNPVTSLSNMTFNYIQRVCWGNYCESGYGTFQLTTAGTWTSCNSGNMTTGCPSGNSYSGTVTSLGGGMWRVFDGLGFNVGTAAVLLSPNGQQVVFLDMKDTRSNGFGIGLLVGSTQQSGTTAQIDGTWISASSAGDTGQFLVSGTQSICQSFNGAACGAYSTTLAFNVPWTGFATTSSGGRALLAGTGMYALQEGVNYVEIGIKIK